MRITKYILHLIACLSAYVGNAQFYPQQSLYSYNPMPIMAAAAGRDDALNVTLSSRSMWQGVEGAPRTQQLALHTPMKKENFAIGMLIVHDKIGISTRSGIMLTGAYRLQLSKKAKISFALTAGIIAANNRWSELRTTDENDPSFSGGNTSHITPNTGASVYYSNKKSFAGFSIPYLLTESYAGGGTHKTTHELSNYNYHLMLGRSFYLNNKFYLKPSALVKYHSRSNMQADITMTAGIPRIGEVGFTYRPGQSLVALMQAKVNGQMSIAYGYDYSLGTLRNYTSGSHELAIIYTFLYQNHAPNTRFF